MMKYEDLVNKRYKEPEDGNLDSRSCISNIDDDEEMEPVAAIAAHLADIIS